MKNITLDINHSQKSRVEHFLNKVNDELESVPFTIQEFKHAGDMVGGFKFKMNGQATFIVVIFAHSYVDANKIGTAHALHRPHVRWTVNGDILFMVESTDEEVAASLLSLFAGKE